MPGYGNNVRITPPIAFPATIAASGSYVSGVFPVPGPGISVTAKLSGTGTLSIQRYADSIGTAPIGAVVTQNLTAATAGDASVNDGVPYLYAQVTITDTSGSTNTLTGAYITVLMD